MRIIFAGTPPFAAAALEALIAARHDIVLVLTQPDRRAGRGLQTTASAVKQMAQVRGVPVQQPITLRDEAVVQSLAQRGPDVMVVAAYGLILPASVLQVPARGCLNIHASLLPRWRGAAPIQRAILAGDEQTGVTIMQMDTGLDTGGILLQQAIPIRPDDTAGSLHDKLAHLGAELIVKALQKERMPVAQDSAGATYAAKIQKSETQIDWRSDAIAIERQVRAFNPAPGAVTQWQGMALKIWSATVIAGSGAAPGTVCETGHTGIVVACGHGDLRITQLQRAGSTRMNAAAFLAGCALERGGRLGE